MIIRPTSASLGRLMSGERRTERNGSDHPRAV
jgi:hypothetical protein